MRAALRWARQVRVSRRQLWLATVVSGAVSTLIVVTAFGQTGPGAAALEAVRGASAASASGPPGSATGSSGGSLGSLPSASEAGSLPTGAPLPSSSPAPASASGGGAGSGVPSGPPAGSGPAKSPGSKKSGSGNGGKARTKPKPTSPVKHVFVISLATGSYADAFGPSSPATYLNGTLRPQRPVQIGRRRARTEGVGVAPGSQ